MIEEALIEAATDALGQWRGREVFPTDLSSAEIRAIAMDLRERSVFSARTTNGDYLGEVAAVVDDILDGRIDMATGRLRLMRRLKELGYDPAAGFPGDMANVPPAEEGSLQDLSSEARLNLVIETNVRMAQSYGQMVQGNEPYALHAYPAWELVRWYPREVPRGAPDSHSVGWMRRWQDAGEAVAWVGAARDAMVARKDSPVWQALGEGVGGHEDTLGNPFPPFAFNSGMAWREVPRARCAMLGLIAPGETPGRAQGEWSPGEREARKLIDDLPEDLRAELRREIAAPEEPLPQEDVDRRAQAATRKMLDYWKHAEGLA